jgi:NAD(P)-dependent dehydrogenase (short-subunit alcohol dehydrogenase family)
MALQEAAGNVEKQFGQLDLLVNCAAILHPTGRGETSLKDVNLQVQKQHNIYYKYVVAMVINISFGIIDIKKNLSKKRVQGIFWDVSY